jgi:hypothetical protein
VKVGGQLHDVATFFLGEISADTHWMNLTVLFEKTLLTVFPA